MSVWNTQWLLGTLIGADTSKIRQETQRSEVISQPATIMEVDDEDKEGVEEHVSTSCVLHMQLPCTCTHVTSNKVMCLCHKCACIIMLTE